MTLRTALLLPLALTLLSGTALRAAEDAPTTGALSLEECVGLALESNFTIRLQHFSTAGAVEDVTVAEAGYDPALTLASGQSGERDRDAATRSDFTDASLGVSQKIVTGATVRLSSAVDRASALPPGVPNPAYGNTADLSLTQPLLKGSGLSVNRAAIDRARLGRDRARLGLKGSVLDTIGAVETAYFNLHYARRLVDVRVFSLTVAETLLDENRRRLEAGTGTSLEVLQAEVGVANARRNLLLARQAASDREDDLRFLLGDVAAGPVPPLRYEESAPAVPVLARSYQKARDNNPDLASTQLSLRQLAIDVTTARNARLPGLDLEAGLGYAGEDARSYGGAIDDTTGGDAYNWRVGLTLSFPWGLRAERARLRQANLGLDREKVRLEQIDQDLLARVRAAVRAVETNRESVDISALATRLSERQYEQEKARYDAGISTFRRVQESQDDLDNVRIAELQARVNLRIALSDLARLETSSLEYYNVSVLDPAR